MLSLADENLMGPQPLVPVATMTHLSPSLPNGAYTVLSSPQDRFPDTGAVKEWKDIAEFWKNRFETENADL